MITNTLIGTRCTRHVTAHWPVIGWFRSRDSTLAAGGSAINSIGHQQTKKICQIVDTSEESLNTNKYELALTAEVERNAGNTSNQLQNSAANRVHWLCHHEVMNTRATYCHLAVLGLVVELYCFCVDLAGCNSVDCSIHFCTMSIMYTIHCTYCTLTHCTMYNVHCTNRDSVTESPGRAFFQLNDVTKMTPLKWRHVVKWRLVVIWLLVTVHCTM